MEINHRTASEGFTLIELLVTLAVLSILLAIAIPSFQSFLRKSRLTAATNDLSSALAMARSEAVKRATTVTVCNTEDPDAASPACSASGDWNAGWLVFVDGGVAGSVDGGDVVLRVFQQSARAGLAISAGSDFTDYVSYLASGVSAGSGGLSNGRFTIDFATCPSPATNLSRELIVGPTGRVRIETGDCV